MCRWRLQCGVLSYVACVVKAGVHRAVGGRDVAVFTGYDWWRVWWSWSDRGDCGSGEACADDVAGSFVWIYMRVY